MEDTAMVDTAMVDMDTGILTTVGTPASLQWCPPVPMAATAAMPPPTTDTMPLPTLRDMATVPMPLPLTLLPTTTMFLMDMIPTILTGVGTLILQVPAPTPLATSPMAMATSLMAMAMLSTLRLPPTSTTVCPATTDLMIFKIHF